jgi:hypothetical protein
MPSLREITRHAFILLTSAPHAYIPPHIEQLSAQILFLPFDIKALVAAIHHAATSLVAAA